MKKYTYTVPNSFLQDAPRNVTISPVDFVNIDGEAEVVLFQPGVSKTAWINIIRLPKDVDSDSDSFKVTLDFGDMKTIEFEDPIILEHLRIDLSIKADIRDLTEGACSVEEVLRALIEEHGKIKIELNGEDSDFEPTLKVTLDVTPFFHDEKFIYSSMEVPKELSEILEVPEFETMRLA